MEGNLPSFLDPVHFHCLPIASHGISEVSQELDDLLHSWTVRNSEDMIVRIPTHFDNLNRLFLHALWPSQLRSLLRLART